MDKCIELEKLNLQLLNEIKVLYETRYNTIEDLQKRGIQLSKYLYNLENIQKTYYKQCTYK